MPRLIGQILSHAVEVKVLVGAHSAAALGIALIIKLCYVIVPNTKHLCGQLSELSYAKFNMSWELHLLNRYTTQLVFHKMNTLYSKHCEINSIIIQKGKPCQHKDHYCGYLPPWNETFPGSTMIITMTVNLPHPSTQFLSSYYLCRAPQLSSKQ